MQRLEQTYFNSPELSHRYELILHLLEYSNHLIMVEGEKDIGKTSLFNHLLAPDESSLIIRKVTASAHLTEEALIGNLINDPSDFDVNDTVPGIDDFMQWLKRCNSKQQIPALLIDDADLLADELIEFVLRLISITEDTLSLHTCMFCEQSFLKVIKDRVQPEGEPPSQHIIEMPHLTEQQTAQYINHVYPEAAEGQGAIEQKTIKQMHRISHGLPGRINALAEQYFHDPAGANSSEEVSEAVRKTGFIKTNRPYIIVGLLLLVLSIALAFILNSAEQEQETQTIKLDLPAQKTTDEIVVSSPVQDRPVVAAIPVSEPEPPAIEDLSPPVIPELAEDIKSGEDVIILVDQQVEESPAAVADVDIETTTHTEVSLTTAEEAAVKLPGEVEEPVVEEQAVVAEVTKEIEKPRDINWLIEQNPNSYVLQLIGAYEKETIDFYLKSFNDNQEQIISFSTMNNGKPWHVLVYGLFSNRQMAVTAIEELPQRARKLAPWPRTVKSVKELMTQ